MLSILTLLMIGMIPSACRSTDPTGAWEITSSSYGQGESYVGIIQFETAGEKRWKAVWNTSVDDHEGIAVAVGSTVAACYAERNRPAELWLFQQGPDGKLVMSIYGSDSQSSEVLDGPAGWAGEFRATAGTMVTILQDKETFTITRKGKGVTKAAGILAGDLLVAGAGEHVGAASYTVKGGSAQGRRYSPETGFRNETLQRTSTGNMNVKFKGRFKP